MTDAVEASIFELQSSPGNATPLFLIHDGGGTILSYLSLGDLGRNVYGIQDPRLESDRSWDGGITEMAMEYVKLIRIHNEAGPIFAGGWSFGGLVSLQIARLLDDEREKYPSDCGALFVAGVVSIDTSYNVPLRHQRSQLIESKPDFPPWTPERTRERIIRRFKSCDEMIDCWNLPPWEVCDERDTQNATLPAGGCQSSHLVRNGGIKEHNQNSHARPLSSCPPILLLKATVRVSLTESTPTEDASFDVDLFRDDAQLGWGQHADRMVQRTCEVTGNHFDLFEKDDNVEMITKIMRKTCTRWDDCIFQSTNSSAEKPETPPM